MLKLHYAPNTISIAIAIALNEGQVHYEAHPVDFATGAQMKPAYLAINPKGRVPALETPGGILTETGAILEYLGETALRDLLPADPLARARMREVMFYLASTMHVNHAHNRRGHRWADRESSWEDMQVKVPQTMAASAAYIEDQIAGPFLQGAELTLADPYLYVISRWLDGDGVEIAATPKLAAFADAMAARASVKSAVAAGMLS